MKPLQNKFNPEKIVLGAGTAIFFNWTKGEKEMIDVGATQGDCTFSYTPEFENIKPRGVRGNVKGLVYVTGSETKIKASFLEWLDPETIKHFLLNANVVEYKNDGSDPDKPAGKGAIIRANESLIDCCGSDAYIDDITIIGQTNGCDMYRITLFNALPTSGIEGVFGDAEVAAEVEFTGYNDPKDPMTPPFEIEFFSPDEKCPIKPPEEKSAKPTIDKLVEGATEVTGNGVKGAKVTIKVNGGEAKEITVDEEGKFKVTVDALVKGQKVTATQKEEGKEESDPVEATVNGDTPKEKSAKPVVTTPKAEDTKVSGTGVVGATISVQVDDGQAKETTVTGEGAFEVVVDSLNENQKVKVIQTEEGKDPSEVVEVTVEGK